jgi:hypothetical protein
MSIRLTRVAPTPATLRPIWSSIPTIEAGPASSAGAAFTRRTSSTRLE